MNYENHSFIRVLMGWRLLRLTVKTSAKNWSIFYAKWLKVDPLRPSLMCCERLIRSWINFSLLQGNIVIRRCVLLLLNSLIALDTNCGGTYEEGSGTILSPGFPGGYADNLDCMWLLYRAVEYPEFIFTEFETESNYDLVSISSGRWVAVIIPHTSVTLIALTKG